MCIHSLNAKLIKETVLTYPARSLFVPCARSPMARPYFHSLKCYLISLWDGYCSLQSHAHAIPPVPSHTLTSHKLLQSLNQLPCIDSPCCCLLRHRVVQCIVQTPIQFSSIYLHEDGNAECANQPKLSLR